MSDETVYLGVYGIFVKDGKLLVIKKGRGPYVGKYDLPGGGLEYGELVLDCLGREMAEEVGAQVASATFNTIGEYQCQYYGSDNSLKNFQHLGLYYIVDLQYEALKTAPDGQDSLGAQFVSLTDLNESNVAPIILPIIERLRSV